MIHNFEQKYITLSDMFTLNNICKITESVQLLHVVDTNYSTNRKSILIYRKNKTISGG